MRRLGIGRRTGGMTSTAMGVVGGSLGVALGFLYACDPRVSVGDLGEVTESAGNGSEVSAGASSSEAGAPSAGTGALGGGPAGGRAGVGGASPNEAGAPPDPAAGAGGGAVEPSPVGCATDLNRFLPPVEVTCPDETPQRGEPCAIAENGVCVWQTGIVGQGNVGYEVLGCYSAEAGTRWYGTGQGNVGPVGSDPQNCPKVMPEADSACEGHAGESCYYPLAACSCDDDASAWSCVDNVKPNLPPRVVERLCPPAGIDESKRIDELSASQVEAWCRWYASPSGTERPPVSDIDPPGFAVHYGTSYTDVNFDACVMDLPVELCVKNFATRPDCNATLRELDDCVESVFADPGGWVGSGCGPFLSNASCQGLIVQRLPENATPSDCKVPIE